MAQESLLNTVSAKIPQAFASKIFVECVDEFWTLSLPPTLTYF